MLETVKRTSNISKCRDLINFELLLYRTFSVSVSVPKDINPHKSEKENYDKGFG